MDADYWILPGLSACNSPHFPCQGSLYLREPVTVDDAVRPAIHGDVYAPIQILPVVMVPMVILGHTVASDKFALRKTRVGHNGLYDEYAVIFQIVIDCHLADPVMLFCRERNIFLEIGIKLQDLPNREI